MIQAVSIKEYFELFNSIDHEGNGVLDLNQLNHIMQVILKRNIDVSIYFSNLLLNKEFAFEDVLMLLTEVKYYDDLKQEVLQKQCLTPLESQLYMCQLECTHTNQRRKDFLSNDLIKAFLTMIREYQKSTTDCEELQKADQRIKKIKEKQIKRWKHYLRELKRYQEQQRNYQLVENQQIKHHEWETFTSEFHTENQQKLQSMKQELQMQLKVEKQKIKDNLYLKLAKIPKNVIDLRSKYQMLVKLKQYQYADNVKQQADYLELQERQKIDREIKIRAKKKVNLLKHQQQLKIQAFLQKMESNSNEFMMQRKKDQHHLQSLNKNLLFDFEEKINRERINSLASRRNLETRHFRAKSAYQSSQLK